MCFDHLIKGREAHDLQSINDVKRGAKNLIQCRILRKSGMPPMTEKKNLPSTCNEYMIQ